MSIVTAISLARSTIKTVTKPTHTVASGNDVIDVYRPTFAGSTMYATDNAKINTYRDLRKVDQYADKHGTITNYGDITLLALY